MRPLHAAAVCGPHTSHLISDWAFGFAVPCTRHIGTETVCPWITVPAATGVDDVMVDASGVTETRLAHDRAALGAPVPPESVIATASPSTRRRPAPPLSCC